MSTEDWPQRCAAASTAAARVLALVAAGHSNRAIARRLGCAPRTVEKRLEKIFRKLGVRDRLNAVRIAQAWGLVAWPADAIDGTDGRCVSQALSANLG